MNAIVDLAAALKDRKGIVAPKARSAPATRTPAPARAPTPRAAPAALPTPPPARAPVEDIGAEAGPRPRGKRSRRSRPDPRHWARLKARVQAEESRADRAETELEKLQATMVAMPWKTIKEMDREIKRLTAALERVERPM